MCRQPDLLVTCGLYTQAGETGSSNNLVEVILSAACRYPTAAFNCCLFVNSLMICIEGFCVCVCVCSTLYLRAGGAEAENQCAPITAPVEGVWKLFRRGASPACSGVMPCGWGRSGDGEGAAGLEGGSAVLVCFPSTHTAPQML